MADEQKTEDTSNNADGQKTEDKKEAVEFSERQQAHIQSLIDNTFAKAYNKAKAEKDNVIAELQTQIAELNKSTNAEDNQKQKEGTKEDYSAVDERIRRIEERENKARQKEMRNALSQAVAGHNAINPNQVVDLLASNVRIDENDNITILNEQGAIRHDRNGNNMQVDEYVNQFMSANSHFLKASGSQGSGSQGQKFGGDETGGELTVEKVRELAKAGKLNEAIANGVQVGKHSFGMPGNQFAKAQ